MRSIVFDRVRLVWKAIGWPLLALTGAAALLLGVRGLLASDRALGLPGAIYSALQLFVFEYNGPATPGWELQVARFLAPAVAGFAAVKAFLLVFGEQLLRLRLRRGHIVVCGFGDKGRAFTRSLRADGYRVVGIELDPTEDAAAAAREIHVPLLAGDACEPALLRKARVHRASHLVAVCGDDGTNAEVAVAARRVPRHDRAGALTCHVHIVDADLCRLLMTSELGAGGVAGIRLEFFNVFADGARGMLADHPPFIDDDGRGRIHMVVVGFDAFGEALVQAAYRSCSWRVPPRRLSISIIPDTDVVPDPGRCPSSGVDCEIQVFDGVGRSGTSRIADRVAAAAASMPVDVVYVCLADEREALRTSLEIRRCLPTARMVVRMMQSTGLAALLASGREEIEVFPIDRVCSPELLFAGPYETIARQLHEEYRRTKTAEGEDAAVNPVLVAWDRLDSAFKEANRDQAAHIGAKLRAIGCRLGPLRGDTDGRFAFTPAEIEFLAEMEHDRWADERRRAGWRPGAVRDVAHRRTPYLVPWAELDERTRDYDRMFIVNLPEFLARAGFEIERLEESTSSPPATALHR